MADQHSCLLPTASTSSAVIVMPSRNPAQIPGKLNIAADYLSRYHLDKESPANVDATTANVWLDELSPLHIQECTYLVD